MEKINILLSRLLQKKSEQENLLESFLNTNSYINFFEESEKILDSLVLLNGKIALLISYMDNTEK